MGKNYPWCPDYLQNNDPVIMTILDQMREESKVEALFNMFAFDAIAKNNMVFGEDGR